MAKVTEKNTKKEILEYVKEIEAKLAEKHEARKTTADVQKEEQVKVIKESAAQLVETGIVNEETVEKYNNLLKTIEMMDKELKDIYGIERSIHTLEAMTISYQDQNEILMKEYTEKKTELENEFNAKKAKWDADLKQLQVDHDKLVKDLKEQFKEEKAALDKERAREKEEYNYNLKRERAKEDDEWEDTKAQREKVLADKEDALVEREQEAEKAIAEMEALKAKVEELKEEIVTTKEEAYEEGKAKAAKDYAIQKSYMEKDCTSKINRLQDKIDTLEAALNQERNAHADTKAKLDDAYRQVTNTAIAVANAGVKVSMDTNK